jgi:hypothetical protein
MRRSFQSSCLFNGSLAMSSLTTVLMHCLVWKTLRSFTDFLKYDKER